MSYTVKCHRLGFGKQHVWSAKPVLLTRGHSIQLYATLFCLRRGFTQLLETYLPTALALTKNQDLSLLKEKSFVAAVMTMINNYRIKTRGKGLTAEQVSSMFKIPFGAEADRGAWEPLQINFMAFVIKVLRFKSFPWMYEDQIKKSVTVMEKLVTLYKDFRARQELLAVPAIWTLCQHLHKIFTMWIRNSDENQVFEWWDGWNTQPQISMEKRLDCKQGTLLLEKSGETRGAMNARIHNYMDVRKSTVKTIQKIIDLVYTEHLGLGGKEKILPKVAQTLEALATVTV